MFCECWFLSHVESQWDFLLEGLPEVEAAPRRAGAVLLGPDASTKTTAAASTAQLARRGNDVDARRGTLVTIQWELVPSSPAPAAARSATKTPSSHGDCGQRLRNLHHIEPLLSHRAWGSRELPHKYLQYYYTYPINWSIVWLDVMACDSIASPPDYPVVGRAASTGIRWGSVWAWLWFLHCIQCVWCAFDWCLFLLQDAPGAWLYSVKLRTPRCPKGCLLWCCCCCCCCCAGGRSNPTSHAEVCGATWWPNQVKELWVWHFFQGMCV